MSGLSVSLSLCLSVSLSLSLSLRITDRGVKAITHGLLKLEHLDLRDLNQMTDRSFIFDLKGDGRPAADREMLKELHILDLTDCARVTHVGAEQVRPCIGAVLCGTRWTRLLPYVLRLKKSHPSWCLQLPSFCLNLYHWCGASTARIGTMLVACFYIAARAPTINGLLAGDEMRRISECCRLVVIFDSLSIAFRLPFDCLSIASRLPLDSLSWCIGRGGCMSH